MKKNHTTYLDQKGDLKRVAFLLAEAARVETLRFFRTPDLDVENKEAGSGFDPVTKADKAAELAMRAILERERPDDAILGEETGHSAGPSGLTWVIDPIDGTRAFLAGAPTWGVLIAVSDTTGPIFGVVDQPYIGERFWGGFGEAFLEAATGSRPLTTRSPRPLSQAVVMTTFPEVGTPIERAAFHAVAEQAQLTRYGMDCYAYALVASGQVDLVIEAGLNAYDIQGPQGVVEAAGGVVTNWTGGPAHQGGQVIAAANTEIHAAAMAILEREIAQ